MTGIGEPFSSCWVCALKDLQNSMMLRPRWPSAGPIGGDGFAAPAGTRSFRKPGNFLAMYFLLFVHRETRALQGPWCGSGRLAPAVTSHGSVFFVARDVR